MERIGVFLSIAALLFGSVFFFPAGSEAAERLAEWEITTTMNIPDLPFTIPPSVVRRCLDEEAVPYQAEEYEQCETITKNVSGKKVTWQVRCVSEEGPVEINGVTHYINDTMDSKAQMTGARGDISMRMFGRKLGPCK